MKIMKKILLATLLFSLIFSLSAVFASEDLSFEQSVSGNICSD